MTGKRSKTALTDWLRGHMPTREQLEHNRYVRPFAHRVLRADLWRFTRRSVPRGVAMGLFVGIFALIPGIQLVCAALMCVPIRGNIPLAAAMTFLSNPATTPLVILPVALWVGSQLGYHSNLSTFTSMIANNASLADWGAWLLSDAAPGLIVGLFVVGALSAGVGYVAAVIGWRMLLSRKWARRRRRRAARRGEAA